VKRPLTRLELEIAWRYLRSRRGSRLLSFITVIAIGGIVVGVSALIVIIGVMNGLQTDLREKILVGSPDIRVLAYGEDLRIPEWKQLLETVKKKKGVVAAAPFALTQALMRKDPGSYFEGVSVAGIAPKGDGGPEVTTIRDHAKEGDFRFASSDGKHRGAVLGKLLADRMSASIGSKLVLITSVGSQVSAVTGFAVPVPRTLEFEVTGVFETGMYEYDNQYVYVDLPAAQELAGLDTAVTGIEVRATSRAEAPAIAEAMHLDFPYHTVDWHEQNSSLFKALSLEKLGMSVILSLIVIVAAFNIVSTLTMVVRDKTREIGILKAMGLPSASVRRIFLAQGLVIGVVGTGLGLAIGLFVGLAISRWHLIALDPQVYFIDHLPVQMQVLDVVLIVVLGVLVATVATLHPAIQASRLYPIEAIRSE
jgi:lipoprotein-releasing system permease protein